MSIGTKQIRSILYDLTGFAFVGIGMTLFSLLLLYLAIEVLAYNLFVSYSFVYILTITLSYFVNSRYVFKVPYDLNDIIKYFLIYLLGMVIGVAVLKLYKAYLPFDDWLLSYLVIPVTFVWNALLSYKLLKKKK